jgi:putative membrane protein insertion efficiency factor
VTVADAPDAARETTPAPPGPEPDADVAQGTLPTPATTGGRIVAAPIVAYRRWVSPALPARCRFHPSCSAYALEAVAVHGPVRGLWLALRRLLRCHPFHPGGYDPVPPRPPTIAE